MTRPLHLVAIALAACSTVAAAAADLLPLKKGIYVPVGRPCRGASNADIVTYWGGRSAIGAAQATSTITSLAKHGNVYRLGIRDKDLQSGSSFAGDPITLTISSPTDFVMGGTRYHYCGATRQF